MNKQLQADLLRTLGNHTLLPSDKGINYFENPPEENMDDETRKDVKSFLKRNKELFYKKLNPKEKRLVKELVKGENRTKAVKEIYKNDIVNDGYAKLKAQYLMNKGNIRAYYLKALAEKGVTPEKISATMSELLEQKRSPVVRGAMIKEYHKVAGLYAPKEIHHKSLSINIDLKEGMKDKSDSELLGLLMGRSA